MVCVRLPIFLGSNKIISETVGPLYCSHNGKIYEFFNSNALNNKQHSIAIICNWRKAFDTCNRSILFYKMEQIL